MSSTFAYWSSFQMTMSPMRIESEKASCRPANRLPRVDCAARPATTEMTPADAKTEVPNALASGKVMRIAAAPKIQIETPTTLLSTRTCVCTFQ